MDIACVTPSNELSERIQRTLGLPDHRFKRYPCLAALVRSLEMDRHRVVLLAGDTDLIETYLMYSRQIAGADAPIVILLTDHDGGSAVDLALAAGVDDYVSLSNGLAQLGTRIRVCEQRRAPKPHTNRILVGGIELNQREGSAMLGGTPVYLTSREFLIAWLLFSNAGRVVTVRALAEVVWGTSIDVAKRSIEQHIYRLRSKLHLSRANDACLTTLYGRGYRIDVSKPSSSDEQGGFPIAGAWSDLANPPGLRCALPR
jgi:DNA-binding response OmpR family regulator